MRSAAAQATVMYLHNSFLSAFGNTERLSYRDVLQSYNLSSIPIKHMLQDRQTQARASLQCCSAVCHKCSAGCPSTSGSLTKATSKMVNLSMIA